MVMAMVGCSEGGTVTTIDESNNPAGQQTSVEDGKTKTTTKKLPPNMPPTL